MRARLAISLLALLIGTAVADQWVAPRVIGDYLPSAPFGEVRDPEQIERLQARIEKLLERAKTGKPPRPRAVNGFDRDLGWSNHLGWVDQGEHIVHVGSRGTRGKAHYAEQSPVGSTRVLCVGDSFVWGSEVSDEQTWPHILEQHPGIEAPNLAVGGYGLDQTLLRLRKEGAAMRPDVVIFGCMLASAGRHGNRIPGRLTPSAPSPQVKPRFYMQGDQLQLLPPPYPDELSLMEAVLSGQTLHDLADHEVWSDPAPWLPSSFFFTYQATQAALDARTSEFIWSDLDSECIQVTLALIEALHAEARAIGAKRSLFLLFPSRGALAEVERGEPRYWAPALAQVEGPYLDVTDALLQSMQPDKPGGSPRATLSELYSQVHLSYLGNRMVAKALLTWLRED
ncbi:MAG: hypothetical protein ACI8QC_001512 [Planctomycetota bacterium]|jgi:hypothetical protein